MRKIEVTLVIFRSSFLHIGGGGGLNHPETPWFIFPLNGSHVCRKHFPPSWLRIIICANALGGSQVITTVMKLNFLFVRNVKGECRNASGARHPIWRNFFLTSSGENAFWCRAGDPLVIDNSRVMMPNDGGSRPREKRVNWSGWMRVSFTVHTDLMHSHWMVWGLCAGAIRLNKHNYLHVSIAPTSIIELLKLKSYQHNHNLHSSQDTLFLQTPSHKTTIMLGDWTDAAPKLENKLPLEIKKSSSLDICK